MKCLNCNMSFSSLKWCKILDDANKFPLCDDCLIKVLEARTQVYKSQIVLTEKKIQDLKENSNCYVYCTNCKHFRLCDEGLPYCPFEDKCNINSYKDSMSISDRPFYCERRYYAKTIQLVNE